MPIAAVKWSKTGKHATTNEALSLNEGIFRHVVAEREDPPAEDKK